MRAAIIVLLVLWLVLALIGVIVEGLLWLLAVAVVLVVVTAAYGWFKLRRHTTT